MARERAVSKVRKDIKQPPAQPTEIPRAIPLRVPVAMLALKCALCICYDLSGTTAPYHPHIVGSREIFTGRIAKMPDLEACLERDEVLMSGVVVSTGFRPAAVWKPAEIVAGGESPHCEMLNTAMADIRAVSEAHPDAEKVVVVVADGKTCEPAEEVEATLAAWKEFTHARKVSVFVAAVGPTKDLNMAFLSRLTEKEIFPLPDFDFNKLFDEIFTLLLAVKDDPAIAGKAQSLKREEIVRLMAERQQRVIKPQ